MKKGIVWIAVAVALAATLATGNTLAFFTDQGEVNNVVTMGNVKITLTEPNFDSETDGTYTLSNVSPGQVIEKDPTVTNVGDHDAYIRCKVTADVKDGFLRKAASSDSSTPEQELLGRLNINTDDWVLAPDGYYYYQKILPGKNAGVSSGGPSHAVLFSQVTVPSGWDWDSSATEADRTFSISVAAEAIQAEHFTPKKDDSGRITGWLYSNGSSVPVESSPASSSSAVPG